MTSSSADSPYMLLFRNAGEETHGHLTSEQRERLTQQWNDWIDRLARTGKLQHGQPLALQGRVISGARGEKVTDGPFAEAKEVVGGYIVVSARNLDEATEIGRGCPGLPLGLTVEVRQLVPVSPVLGGVQARPPAGSA